MRSSEGSEFRSEGAATANDRSPIILLVIRLNGMRRRLLVDRKLYLDPDCNSSRLVII